MTSEMRQVIQKRGEGKEMVKKTIGKVSNRAQVTLSCISYMALEYITMMFIGQYVDAFFLLPTNYVYMTRTKFEFYIMAMVPT